MFVCKAVGKYKLYWYFRHLQDPKNPQNRLLFAKQKLCKFRISKGYNLDTTVGTDDENKLFVCFF